MFGPAPLRDIFLMAMLELKEMLRTRRVLIVLALYVLGGFVAAFFFVEVLAQIEQAAAQALGTSATGRPGALTQQLLKEPSYQRMFRGLLKGSGDVDYLMQMPAMTLFFAWSSMTFVPMLVMLTATDTVAQEMQTRGIRFLVFRTGKLEILLGKTLGQALLLALVTLLTALVYTAVSAYGLYDFQLGPTLQGMLFFWPRVLTYGCAFLAMGIAISSVASSVNLARGLSIVSLLTLGAMNRAITMYKGEHPGIWWDAIQFVLPFYHRDMLWHTDWTMALGTMVTLFALSGVYLAAGLMVFQRRDV